MKIGDCVQCVDRLRHDDRLRGSSPDLIVEALRDYHRNEHHDLTYKSTFTLMLEREARASLGLDGETQVVRTVAVEDEAL